MKGGWGSGFALSVWSKEGKQVVELERRQWGSGVRGGEEDEVRGNGSIGSGVVS